MPKSIGDNTKKRGRPVTTGKGMLIGVRMLDPQLDAIDVWVSKQKKPQPSRPEAIRRLVDLGLAAKTVK